MHCVRCLLTFRKTLLLPSSGSKNKPSNQEHVSAKPVLQLLAEEEKDNCLSGALGMLDSAETNENFVTNIVTVDEHGGSMFL